MGEIDLLLKGLVTRNSHMKSILMDMTCFTLTSMLHFFSGEIVTGTDIV